MDRSYVAENNKSRERLRKLVAEITDEELQLVIYKEGWTIAVVLGHLAFWDERRVVLVRQWKKNGITPSGLTDLDTDVINDAILPFLLVMPPRKAAELAVSAAEKVDREIAGLSDELAKKIEALGDRHALNRAIHRKMHLDEIDVLLKAKRGR